MTTEIIKCPHCGEQIRITEEISHNSGSYSGTGTVSNPHDVYRVEKTMITDWKPNWNE